MTCNHASLITAQLQNSHKQKGILSLLNDWRGRITTFTGSRVRHGMNRIKKQQNTGGATPPTATGTRW